MKRPTPLRYRRHRPLPTVCLVALAAVCVMAVAAAAFPAVAAAAGSGVIVNFAGNPDGTAGDTGDGGPATTATLKAPIGVTVDTAGNIYIADFYNNRIRKVDTAGTITDFAGSPAATAGNTGDGGPATSALLDQPAGVAVDSAGNIYFTDRGNNRIRKVDTAGTITDFAGSPAATLGNSGDGGPATSATLNFPNGVTVDTAGNVYIADTGNHRIRKVDTAGTIVNFAGSPAAAFGNNGDGSPATSATLDFPEGMTVDTAGNVYIADTSNNRIREVLVTTLVSVVRPAPALIIGGGLLLILLAMGAWTTRRGSRTNSS
jgi:sugar lactone lactonase YvrE